MKITATDSQQGSDILYNIYQTLPIGAVFVDSSMKILSANRKMRVYFPFHPAGLDGLLVGDAIRCMQAHGEIRPCGQQKSCPVCILFRGVQMIIRENRSMPETEMRHICFLRSHRQIQWFRVSGAPVSFCRQRYAILFFNDITDQVKHDKILQKKLKLDQSTKVLNKTSLIRCVDSLLRSKTCGPITLCMIDFDNFKQINDHYGHLTGDKVLNTFSRIARKKIRSGDLLGRYGGEEFLFLFRAGLEQSVQIIRRIQNELRNAFEGIVSEPVTFSAGIVHRDSGGAPLPEWDDLTNLADHLLYQAKAYGKNRIVTNPPIKISP